MKRISALIIIYIICGLLLATMFESTEVMSAEADTEYSKILVTSKVIEALGNIGDSKARAVIVKALKSKEYFIRASAVQALCNMQDKESIPVLKKLIKDNNYLVRILAICTLFELGQQDMEKKLINLLKDDDPTIRATVAGEVGRFGEDFLSILNEMLSKEKDYSVRAKLIGVLGSSQFAPALVHINQAIDDSNKDVRRAACEAAGQIGDRKSLSLLLERLGDEEIPVRSAAKVALAHMGEKRLAKLFWDDIDDEHALLRTSSFQALAIFEDLDILPILLKEIVNPESPTMIKMTAAGILARLKPSVSELVHKALAGSKTQYNDLLSESVEVDYKANDRDLSLIFIEALRDVSSPLHQDAPLILSALGERRALPALREALLQDNPDLVATAAHALGTLRDKDAVGYLIKVFNKYGI